MTPVRPERSATTYRWTSVVRPAARPDWIKRDLPAICDDQDDPFGRPVGAARSRRAAGHRDEGLDAFAAHDPLEQGVDQGEVRGLRLAAVGEDRRHRPRGVLQGHSALDRGEGRAGRRVRAAGDAAPLGPVHLPVGGRQLGEGLGFGDDAQVDDRDRTVRLRRVGPWKPAWR
ncbi:hypothetical protein ACIBG6_01575 [Streptomyces sp. NPDC050842]|uniref:hypothetical protein n=1 Tax=Streptomyces sp. NPDC050842 TaxID=3365636 RepID=UPI00379C8C38